MIAGHRWEYQSAFRGHKCMPLPIGGVESHQWCVGCGCFIADKILYDRKIPISEVYLDILASEKGYEPIEAGTLAESKLNKRKDQEIIRDGRDGLAEAE